MGSAHRLPENHLLSATKAGAAAAYTYDALGRRLTKTVNGTLTNYLSAGDEEVAEYDASNNMLRRYIPGPGTDQPVAMVTVSGATNTLRFFHADRQGSILAMADATGAMIEGPYTYDPYGNSASSTAGVPFRYTGRRLDPETGLYYYRARYYSVGLGRFFQTDPIAYNDQMNLYGYVKNSPLNASDPSGLEEMKSWHVKVTSDPAGDAYVAERMGRLAKGIALIIPTALQGMAHTADQMDGRGPNPYEMPMSETFGPSTPEQRITTFVGGLALLPLLGRGGLLASKPKDSRAVRWPVDYPVAIHRATVGTRRKLRSRPRL